MSLKHGLLGLLNYEGATTGYDLDKFFKSSLNHFWQAKTSQIYRELSAMENMGWLTSKRVVQEEKPNKRVYSITPQGKEEFIKWLTSPDAALSGEVRSAFLMKLFFAGEVEKDFALNMLRKCREECAAAALMVKEIYKEIDEEAASMEDAKHVKYWKLTVLNGEFGLKAAVEWADKAIAILEEEEE